jgi:hypothetical protein
MSSIVRSAEGIVIAKDAWQMMPALLDATNVASTTGCDGQEFPGCSRKSEQTARFGPLELIPRNPGPTAGVVRRGTRGDAGRGISGASWT